MRRPLYNATFAVYVTSVLLLAGVGSLGTRLEAQEEPSAVLLGLLNEARLDEGLNPYYQSRLLTDAAQRHSQDIAMNGFADPEDVHLGSDGSSAQERIEEAGYAAWTRDERLVVAENVWSGIGGPEDALASFLEEPAQRDRLFSDIYREIGVGVATDADGRSFYVLDFGARPNVLPIFINDGAASTENREVAIRLTNERARPEGRGTSGMGEAIEIRISNQPAFEGLSWQPWAPLVSWMLPDSPGAHTVYVEYRDAAGRTATSADSIVLDTGTPTTPTHTPDPSALEPTVGPTLEATDTPGILSPESGGEGSPPAPESSPSPTSQVSAVTPYPTWTPLPSPTSTEAASAPSPVPVASSAEMGRYWRYLAAVGGLQGAVILLGIYLMMRRGGSTRGGQE